MQYILLVISFVFLSMVRGADAETVALWLFDEPVGLYPSCVLGDAQDQRYPLVIGLGGTIVSGKYGDGLSSAPHVDRERLADILEKESGSRGPSGPNATVPLRWRNADFCALMTRGEQQVRQEVGFGSATGSKLNLGHFDWTVEFRFRGAKRTDQPRTVFEIGTGPRGDAGEVTRLSLVGDQFVLVNGNSRLVIPTSSHRLLDDDWHHVAFVYVAGEHELKHYVDGRQQEPADRIEMRSIAEGDEDYLAIGRDASWRHPLDGTLDEMRISDHAVYLSDFAPPDTFSRLYATDYEPAQLQTSLPLLFPSGGNGKPQHPLPLGQRKHLFVDDALIDRRTNISFVPCPPRKAERIDDQIAGHLIVCDLDGKTLHLYYEGPKRSLAVMTSVDGVTWERPDLGPSLAGWRNIVITDPVGLGTVFVDPNAPPAERIKYVSGYRGRGFFVYSSPDGFTFHRNETMSVPFRGASQSNVFYDDQRGVYVGFHRTDIAKSAGGKTLRSFVRTETTDVMRPWPFHGVTYDQHRQVAQSRRLSSKVPYFLDNGPLTPPGFGIEYPTTFGYRANLDPEATDVYIPKCLKYDGAPDTYLGFPVVYFHYQGDGPATRQTLGEKWRQRGSGPTETQLSVSRDGIEWTRYPRPAYVGIGRHDGLDIHMAYTAHGMVTRGDEIWQYYLGSEPYHSPWQKGGRRAVFRLVQQRDRFVALQTPYSGGSFVTHPLTFDGDALTLNIDTDATGFAQVGLLDVSGIPIAGYSIDESVYINGDFMSTTVQWRDKGTDVAPLAGRPVRIAIRMRGASLYGLRFVATRK